MALGLINHEEAIIRIVAVYNRASTAELTAGLEWYPFYAARIEEFGASHGLDKADSIALFACLSTGTRVERNWTNFVAATVDRNSSRIVQAYPVMKNKVDRFFSGDATRTQIISGQKVTSFFHNLTGDHSRVTVDRHAAAIAYGYANGDMKMTPKEYVAIEDAYRAAGVVLDVSPASVQAVTWIVWRRLKGILDNGGSADLTVDRVSTRGAENARAAAKNRGLISFADLLARDAGNGEHAARG